MAVHGEDTAGAGGRVRQHEPAIDARPSTPPPHAHPARHHGHGRPWETLQPWRSPYRRWRDHDAPGRRGAAQPLAHVLDLGQRDACVAIRVAHLHHGAMGKQRVREMRCQHCDQALRLAEGVREQHRWPAGALVVGDPRDDVGTHGIAG